MNISNFHIFVYQFIPRSNVATASLWHGHNGYAPPIYGQRCFPLYINEYYSITKIAILSDIHNIYCKKWKISNLDK